MALTALIPKMTSGTAPSGEVSASTEYSGTFPAWKAAAQVFGFWCTADGTHPQWIQYQAVSSLTATHYSVVTHINSSWVMTAWELRGSNNGTDWTTLDTRSSQGTSLYMMYEIPAENVGAYTYYRIYITAGSAAFDCIYSWQLYNASSPSDPDTIISTAGGNWKNGGLLSGTAVKNGVTFGLSGTGSLVAEQHTNDEVLVSASVPGNYKDAKLTGSNVRLGSTFGLSGTGSYTASALTDEQSQKLDELWRFKGFSTVLPLGASGDGVSQKVLTSGTVTLTISGTGVVRI